MQPKSKKSKSHSNSRKPLPKKFKVPNSKRELSLIVLKNDQAKEEVLNLVGVHTTKQNHWDIILTQTPKGNLRLDFKSGLGTLKAEIERKVKARGPQKIELEEKLKPHEGGTYMTCVIKSMTAKQFKANCIPKNLALKLPGSPRLASKKAKKQ